MQMPGIYQQRDPAEAAEKLIQEFQRLGPQRIKESGRLREVASGVVSSHA